MDELDKIGNALNTISFDSLIGNALKSCVDAQCQAAEATKKYIDSVAYLDDTSREDLAKVVFVYKKADTDKMAKLSVPLLTVVPIPYLRINNIDLSFTAEVESLEDSKINVSVTNASSASEIAGSTYASANGRLKVNIKAEPADIPPGLAALYEIMGGNGIILEKDVKYDPPEIKGLLQNIRSNIAAMKSPQKASSKICGIHVNWTKPSTVKNPLRAYFVEDFDLLTTILSALLWRKYNGPIKLYTDNLGYRYYAGLGLLNLWDGGVDIDVLNSIGDDVDAEIFWAGGKLFAQKNEVQPYFMIDTDLMVWKNITEDVATKQVAVYHKEELDEYFGCYIPYESLKKRKGYLPEKKWNWTVLPCNMALSYFSDMDFKCQYVDKAIDFMKGNKERPDEMVSQMVFAEQRLFAMEAERFGVKVHSFLSYPDEIKGFTHVWGYKRVAKNNKMVRRMLCKEFISAIKTVQPDYEWSEQMKIIINKYL